MSLPSPRGVRAQPSTPQCLVHLQERPEELAFRRGQVYLRVRSDMRCRVLCNR